MRHLPESIDFGPCIDNAARLPHEHVRIRPEDPIAQLRLQAGHQRQRDHERHDANGDAERRDQRNDRNERLLPLGEQISEGNVEFEGHVHSVASRKS